MFERFTDRARRVLVLAQDEARILNHSFIGTEHLLLGLIREEEGVAAAALGSLGVSLEGVRRKVDETIGMGDSAPSGSPPFTPRAKRVMELALRESMQMGHSYIGTEHLLLGIVREGEGVASSVLLTLGVDLGRVRQAILALLSGRTDEELRSSPFFEVGNEVEFLSRSPQCAQCRSAVEADARYRTLDVPAVDDDASDPIRVVVVFCSRCGSTLATFPSTSAETA